MLPDRVSNPGPLTYESGALPIALRGPAELAQYEIFRDNVCVVWQGLCNKYLMLIFWEKNIYWTPFIITTIRFVVVVVLLFYVHGEHLWSCRDGQLT